MTNRYSTGEMVHLEGQYICEAGLTRDYQEGDCFERCPLTDLLTKWRRLDESELS